MYISFQVSVLGFFGYIPRSRITESKGRSVLNFLRNLHSVFHSSCTSLHSHQQYTRVPFSPHPHQHLQFVYLLIAIWPGVRSYFIVVINLHLIGCRGGYRPCLKYFIEQPSNTFPVSYVLDRSVNKCMFNVRKCNFKRIW